MRFWLRASPWTKASWVRHPEDMWLCIHWRPWSRFWSRLWHEGKQREDKSQQSGPQQCNVQAQPDTYRFAQIRSRAAAYLFFCSGGEHKRDFNLWRLQECCSQHGCAEEHICDGPGLHTSKQTKLKRKQEENPVRKQEKLFPKGFKLGLCERCSSTFNAFFIFSFLCHCDLRVTIHSTQRGGGRHEVTIDQFQVKVFLLTITGKLVAQTQLLRDCIRSKCLVWLFRTFGTRKKKNVFFRAKYWKNNAFLF